MDGNIWIDEENVDRVRAILKNVMNDFDYRNDVLIIKDMIDQLNQREIL